MSCTHWNGAPAQQHPWAGQALPAGGSGEAGDTPSAGTTALDPNLLLSVGQGAEPGWPLAVPAKKKPLPVQTSKDGLKKSKPATYCSSLEIHRSILGLTFLSDKEKHRNTGDKIQWMLCWRKYHKSVGEAP